MKKRQPSLKPISCGLLAHSLGAGHRVEDALWRILRDMGCLEQSGAAVIKHAMADARQDCPPWCEVPAWNLMADVIERWAVAHGSLEVFWKLRRKKED